MASATPTIAVNARYRCHIGKNPSGVQRYAVEIHRHISSRLDLLTPERMQTGVSGHMWEQFVLPALVRRRLLWNPSGTGPIVVSHQVSTIHDTTVFDHPEWFKGIYARWVRCSAVALARRAAHVITVSSFSKERILSATRVDEKKVSVIAEGVGPEYHPRDPAEVEVARTQFGIPVHRRYILYVGTIEPRKNMARLLRAWKLALARMPDDVVLVLAGARGLPRVFGGVALEPPPERVLFTGYVPDESLPALYTGATAFVYPSLYEGFGLPALEAMSCGTPVVTSAVASLPEVVGPAARLIDPLNEGQLAEAMMDLVSDEQLRESLARAGRARSAKFTWDRAAAETLATLERFA